MSEQVVYDILDKLDSLAEHKDRRLKEVNLINLLKGLVNRISLHKQNGGIIREFVITHDNDCLTISERSKCACLHLENKKIGESIELPYNDKTLLNDRAYKIIQALYCAHASIDVILE